MDALARGRRQVLHEVDRGLLYVGQVALDVGRADLLGDGLGDDWHQVDRLPGRHGVRLVVGGRHYNLGDGDHWARHAAT